MKPFTFCILAVFVCIAAVLAGCTGTSGTPSSTGTQAPAADSSSTAAPADNLAPSPTDSMPDNNYVSVTVKEKEYDATILVVFDGGRGQYLTTSATATIYRADGQVFTEKLGINKGDFVKFQGTKQTDRVVAFVSQANGVTYKVADTLSPYRTRG